MRKGFWYRAGVLTKEFGERMAHVRLFGSIRIFRFLCLPVIGIGKIITVFSRRFYRVGDLV